MKWTERELKDKIPFSSMMSKTSFGSKTYFHPLLPGNVIREFRFPDGECIELAKRYRTSFDRLKNYGISVPCMEFVIGYAVRGERCLYIITEWIDGVDEITDVKNISRAMARDICEWLKCLGAYFANTQCNEADYLCDLHPEQFMYGTTKENTKPRVILADVDPYIQTHHLGSATENSLFKTGVNSFVEYITYLDRRLLDTAISFTSVLQEFMDLTQEISKNKPEHCSISA